MFFKEPKSKSPISLLSIIDALAKKLMYDNVRKVGLLEQKLH